MASASAQTPAFEAASIRPTVRAELPGALTDLRPGGAFGATNATLLELIRVAWNLEPYRIAGGPDWIRTERFDVEARAGSPITADETRLRLRALLEERFALRARLERREAPIYALVASRNDKRLGPGMRPAAPAACVDRGPQPGRAPAGALPSCGLLPMGPGRMSGRRVPLSLFTLQLSSVTGRVVVDRTGFDGMFDIDLEWALTEGQVSALAQLTPPGGTPPKFDPDAPGLFTAIVERMGLKLEPASGPIDLLVIESAERLIEN